MSRPKLSEATAITAEQVAAFAEEIRDLTPAEKWDLMEKQARTLKRASATEIEKNDAVARLFVWNQGTIRHWTRKRGGLCSEADLIANALVHVEGAALTFDANKGAHFPHWLGEYLRDKLLSDADEMSRTIRQPSSIREDRAAMKKAAHKFEVDEGRKPDVDELVEKTKLKYEAKDPEAKRERILELLPGRATAGDPFEVESREGPQRIAKGVVPDPTDDRLPEGPVIREAEIERQQREAQEELEDENPARAVEKGLIRELEKRLWAGVPDKQPMPLPLGIGEEDRADFEAGALVVAADLWDVRPPLRHRLEFEGACLTEAQRKLIASRSTWWRWTRGEAEPDQDTLGQIAVATGHDLRWLLSGARTVGGELVRPAILEEPENICRAVQEHLGAVLAYRSVAEHPNFLAYVPREIRTPTLESSPQTWLNAVFSLPVAYRRECPLLKMHEHRLHYFLAACRPVLDVLTPLYQRGWGLALTELHIPIAARSFRKRATAKHVGGVVGIEVLMDELTALEVEADPVLERGTWTSETGRTDVGTLSRIAARVEEWLSKVVNQPAPAQDPEMRPLMMRAYCLHDAVLETSNHLRDQARPLIHA